MPENSDNQTTFITLSTITYSDEWVNSDWFKKWQELAGINDK